MCSTTDRNAAPSGWLADRRRRRQVVVGLLLAAAVLPLLGAAGARLNTTSSLAYGVYWVQHQAPAPGGYASFCPMLERPVFALANERGYLRPGSCPGGVRPLLKRVMAAAGDTVAIDARGVHVNGRLLPHSRPLRADGAGRPMPVLALGERRLGHDELLLMSDVNGNSFDARYFGPIARWQVDDVVRPVWTW